MLLVSDANVFIDFEVAELIGHLFRLPHEIIVPDILYEAEGLSLLGTLTLMEHLFVHSIAALNDLRKGYERMRIGGRRLPWDEIQKQLSRLERGL